MSTDEKRIPRVPVNNREDLEYPVHDYRITKKLSAKNREYRWKTDNTEGSRE